MVRAGLTGLGDVAEVGEAELADILVRNTAFLRTTFIVINTVIIYL